MLRAAGIVALFVFTACGQTTPVAVASPSPVIAQGSWAQSLTFTGAITGQMTGIVADSGSQVNACTGSKTRTGEQWADTFYGTTAASGQVWEIVFTVNNFRGPGAYHTTDVSLVVRTPDKARVWLSQGRDRVTFTVEPSQQSGTVDASLTDAASGRAGSLRIAGRWNCRG
jgi:hypothetical protein